MCNYRLNMPQAKEAARLYAENHSLRQIAESFGVSQFAVASAIEAVGAELRSREEGARLRHGVFIEYQGKRLTLSEWARELGKPRSTIASRYQVGKSVADILR